MCKVSGRPLFWACGQAVRKTHLIWSNAATGTTFKRKGLLHAICNFLSRGQSLHQFFDDASFHHVVPLLFEHMTCQIPDSACPKSQSLFHVDVIRCVTYYLGVSGGEKKTLTLHSFSCFSRTFWVHELLSQQVLEGFQFPPPGLWNVSGFSIAQFSVNTVGA